jgi:hypothetical protein
MRTRDYNGAWGRCAQQSDDDVTSLPSQLPAPALAALKRHALSFLFELYSSEFHDTHLHVFRFVRFY